MPTEAESLPLDQYLVQHGVDPAQAAVLGAQGDAMAGRRAGPAAAPSAAVLQALERSAEGNPRQRGAIAASALERAPDAASPPPQSTVTQAQAQAALDAHTEGQLRAQLEHDFAPPANAWEYRFPNSLAPETEEAMAADTELRTALHAEGLPRHVVETAAAALADATAKRMNETADEAQARLASTRTTLERWYGNDHAANMRLADTVFDALLARGGAVADFVANAIPHLDALSIDAVVQFARHRASRR